jgi:scyllo-inositol 2-dehydrogenase (NADP+)
MHWIKKPLLPEFHMRVIIAGLGVQGCKRKEFCGSEFVGYVDPHVEGADFKTLEAVPLGSYDAVLACIPDKPKAAMLEYALAHGKHVLVEKPLWLESADDFKKLTDIGRNNNIVCYTAYNHRFEPHFERMAALIHSGELGRIYSCRMFYGNGTARLVRESAWRDTGGGVLPDLGSHLIDTCVFWFGEAARKASWKLLSANSFENRAPDHVVITAQQPQFRIELEMTMLMWRNHFTCDILAENGSAHIESLCKWGPSTFTYRKRILPSGRPTETQTVLTQPDPTWKTEYLYFKSLIANKSTTDLSWDAELMQILSNLEAQIV